MSPERFWRNSSQCRDRHVASFRCYDNYDVIATLIITNFHLSLMQLWWKIFNIIVDGDVVQTQNLEVSTLKNSIEPPLRRRLARIENVM